MRKRAGDLNWEDVGKHIVVEFTTPGWHGEKHLFTREGKLTMISYTKKHVNLRIVCHDWPVAPDKLVELR